MILGEFLVHVREHMMVFDGFRIYINFQTPHLSSDGSSHFQRDDLEVFYRFL